ncbi:LacI family transcriptional regulator [Saccharothrix sp. S26]|uniref:LacI family DNA-binding transcriptional regulator n=1 Tax=Saccharothrix sp. S26 TaxID=2907215 RepID=UPI001F19E03D|nr:LacI family DNA-binding transcriptional regulator [Saccharothrix sp. S26]MCE7000229.1 LacI family transcriptional regulator [Saccharothrix sp. S26]
MTTIREIAQLCGVSVATVSRVFNQPLTVSKEKREVVERVARELDYRPNESARALATKRSGLIGLVWDTDHRRPGWRHPYLQELLIGLKSALSAHGYHLLMLATSGSAALRAVGASLADPVAYVNMTRRHHLGGLVLIDSGSDAPAFAAFAQSGLPCVAVDVDVDGPRATYVTSDNVGGAAMAVRHLVEAGHRRIATITGPRANRPAADRLDGFRAAMAEAGLAVPPEYVVEGDFYRPSGQSATRSLIALPEPPTAVFCAGDEMAVGALLAARHAGLRVPDDLAVVGFDDIELAALVEPPLTTLAQDKAGIGVAAARAVLTMVHGGEKPPPAFLPTRLVVRSSSR